MRVQAIRSRLGPWAWVAGTVIWPTLDGGDVPETTDVFPHVFIAHAHVERDLAVIVKDRLRMIGFKGFVAHADIEPTREWEEEIRLPLPTLR